MIVDRRAKVEAPDSPRLADEAASGFGIYVHIPFCASKCGYCDFASFEGLENLIPRYVETLLREIEESGVSDATSAFIGGGTPSLLSPDDLGRIIRALPIRPGGEITVEANPESLTAARAEAIALAGGNRVSIGMQSARGHVLAALDRSHRPESVAAAVKSCREVGINRVNLDLIYGTSGEGRADLEASLEAALSLEPEHISAYALTLEPNTPLARAVAEGRIGAPDEDAAAEKMTLVDEILSSAGLVRYEVSAWARPGEACRHNLLYWGCGQYRGYGAAAHSHVSGGRFWNATSPARYIDSPRPVGEERPDCRTRLQDVIALGMRRVVGLPESLFGDLAPVTGCGLASSRDGRVRPTPKGLALNNELVLRLLSLAGADC